MANPLTPREHEVFLLLAAGKRNKVIARELKITEGTVKAYAHAIYAKKGVASRYEIMAPNRREEPHMATYSLTPDQATLLNLLAEERRERLILEARVRTLEIACGLAFGDPEEVGELLCQKEHIKQVDDAFWADVKRQGG